MDRRSVAFFVTAAVCFGSTFVAAKAGLAYFPPLLFVALRFYLAAGALAAFVLLTTSPGERLPRSTGDLVGILATGVFAIGVTNALIFVGQQYTTSGVASIISSLNPIVTPVFAATMLSDERLSGRDAVGLLVALVGVALVVDLDPATLSGTGAGALILLGSVVTGAFGSVLVRRTDSDLSSTVRTAWGVPLAAVLVHATSVAAGESPGTIAWSPVAVASLLYVALVAGAVAYIAYFELLDSAGAIRTNLVFYLVPVVGTAGGWLVLGESVDTGSILGFLVIAVGFSVLVSGSLDFPDRLTRRLPRNSEEDRSDRHPCAD